MTIEIYEGGTHKTIRNVIHSQADTLPEERNGGEALILFYTYKTKAGNIYTKVKEIDRTAEVIIKQA